MYVCVFFVCFSPHLSGPPVHTFRHVACVFFFCFPSHIRILGTSLNTHFGSCACVLYVPHEERVLVEEVSIMPPLIAFRTKKQNKKKQQSARNKTHVPRTRARTHHRCCCPYPLPQQTRSQVSDRRPCRGCRMQTSGGRWLRHRRRGPRTSSGRAGWRPPAAGMPAPPGTALWFCCCWSSSSSSFLLSSVLSLLLSSLKWLLVGGVAPYTKGNEIGPGGWEGGGAAQHSMAQHDGTQITDGYTQRRDQISVTKQQQKNIHNKLLLYMHTYMTAAVRVL